MTSFMNSTRYRLFEIGPFIPSSYSYIVEAHSLSERMSRYIHSETFHVVLQESQNVMIELVNSLGILICLVISLLSTRIMPFSKSLGLPSFFADSTRPTKSLFSRRSLCSMRSWESATPLSSVPFLGI